MMLIELLPDLVFVLYAFAVLLIFCGVLAFSTFLITKGSDIDSEDDKRFLSGWHKWNE